MAKIKPAHHRGSHQVRAARLVALANANPSTVCWRCGQPARAGDPWQAGHKVDGMVDGPLAAEHRSCNARAGQALSAKRRRPLQTSRDW
jgi:hypothetical protein